MAKELSKTGISTSSTIKAGHVSQSIDALTGTEAYDITISGSLTTTGSVQIKGSTTLQNQVAFTGVGSDSISSAGTNILTIDGTGTIYKTGSYSSGGGSTSAAGDDGSIQYAIGGGFNASSALRFSPDEQRIYVKHLYVTGSVTSSGQFTTTGAIRSTGGNISTTTQVIGATGSFDIVSGDTGSFSYITGSSPIVIDADNIKVSSAGVVSGISSIDAASLNFNSLPTADPEVSGRLYRSGKLMQISTGSGSPGEESSESEESS